LSGIGAVSSVGRASRLHREGQRFEPVTAHHKNKALACGKKNIREQFTA
jgi:hypothetical protein